MVADARPKTVAYFIETTFATPPADWDASGTEIYTIGPDPGGAMQALVENENYLRTHLGSHGRIRGLKNCEVALGGLYLHGSPNVTAETAQAVAIPLSDLCEVAWGGVKRGYAEGFAGGTAAAPDLDSDANFAVGDWIFARDATDGEGEFIKITALPGAGVITPDRPLTFTPDAGGADTARAVIMCYPHGAALREHTDAAHKTLSVFMKGDHAEDLYEFVGCKLNLTMGEVVAGAPSKLDAALVVTTWDNDGLSAPTLSTTPAGEAPGIPGTGDNTFVMIADKGTAMASVECYQATPSLSITHERVTGPNGTEGVHGHIAAGMAESTLTLVLEYDNAWQAKFEADTRQHCLIQVGTGDNAWGIYFPDLELQQPKRTDQNGITAVTLTFHVHEDTSGSTDFTRAPWLLLLATK